MEVEFNRGSPAPRDTRVPQKRSFVAAAGALGLSPGVPAANDLNRVSTCCPEALGSGPFTVPNTAL